MHSKKFHQRPFYQDAASGQILMRLDEFMRIRLLGFQRPPSRTVAAISVRRCDRDDRHPSSMSAEIEALDVLGFLEQDGQIPILRPYMETSLTLTQSGQNTLHHKVMEASACDVCAMSRLEVISP